MEFRPTLDDPAVRLVLHDLAQCAELCRAALAAGEDELPPSVRDELVLCIAASEMAADTLRRPAGDCLHALEFAETTCRECVAACARVGGTGEIELCARMAGLCSESLQQLLYDAL